MSHLGNSHCCKLVKGDLLSLLPSAWLLQCISSLKPTSVVALFSGPFSLHKHCWKWRRLSEERGCFFLLGGYSHLPLSLGLEMGWGYQTDTGMRCGGGCTRCFWRTTSQTGCSTTMPQVPLLQRHEKGAGFGSSFSYKSSGWNCLQLQGAGLGQQVLYRPEVV